MKTEWRSKRNRFKYRPRMRERSGRRTASTGNTDSMESEVCVTQRKKPTARSGANISEAVGNRATKDL
ncbi:hypothetical protein SLE2022_151580 [Rubroshorea leprosula]